MAYVLNVVIDMIMQEYLLTYNALPCPFSKIYNRIQAFDVRSLFYQDENYYPLAFVQVLILNLY